MEKKLVSLTKQDIIAVTLVGILASLLTIPVILNLNLKISYLLPFVIFVPLCIVGIYVGYFFGKKFPLIFQFTKFGEVGGLNWLMDFGFLNLFILISGISTGVGYSVLKGSSFIIAVVNSYFWNKFWVFKGAEGKTSTEFVKFISVSLIGLGINVVLASLVVYFSFAGSLGPKIWANLGAIVGSLTAMAWNFIGYKLWVFKK